MKKVNQMILSKQLILFVIVIFIATFFSCGVGSVNAAGSFPDAEKDIGFLSGTTFDSERAFYIGQDAFIRLTVRSSTGSSGGRAPVDIVLVLDASNSMKDDWDGQFAFGVSPSKIDVVKYSYNQLIDKLDPSTDRVGLVVFSHDVRQKHPLSSNFESVKNEIESISLQGGSDLGEGLEAAIDELSSKKRSGAVSAIAFASDGRQDVGGSYITFFDNDIFNRLKSNNIIHYSTAIGEDMTDTFDRFVAENWRCPAGGYTVDTQEKYLKCPADVTGGEYIYSQEPQDFFDAYNVNLPGHWNRDYSISFQDTINTIHLRPLGIEKVTDLSGRSVSSNISLSSGKVSGDFGMLPPNTGRYIYIRVRIEPGSSGTTWTTIVDAPPDANNRVLYKDAKSGSTAGQSIFNNISITIGTPGTPLPTSPPPPSSTPRPTVTPYPTFASASVQGSTYLDLNANCSKDGGEPGAGGLNLKIEQIIPNICGRYTESRVSDSNGNYQFLTSNCYDGGGRSTYRMTATNDNPAYELTCGSLFNLNLTAGSPITQAVPITVLRDPWIQVNAGGVHANGSITSKIPLSAVDKYLIRKDPDVASAQSITLDDGAVSSKNWRFSGYSQFEGDVFDYEQVTKALKSFADSTDFTGEPPNRNASNDDGVAILYAQKDQVTLSGDWQAINFPVIIVVDGTNTSTGDIIIPSSITGSKITLGDKGFLLFLASNDIRVADAIGEIDGSSAQANLEGYFVAGRNFNAGGTGDRLVDRRLNIAGGVFVGMRTTGGYISRRSHAQNHFYPSDYFSYNPKLIINAPRILTSSAYEWRETEQ